MMQKLVKCAVVGGIVLFVWGAISWTVLPWHKMNMMKFRNEEKVARVIQDNAPESGIYVMPNMMDLHKGSEEKMKAEQSMQQGPFMFAAICLQGMNPKMTGSMVKAFILKVVLAFIVSWLLMQTKPMSFNRKVGFITVVGVALAFSATLPYAIWFAFSKGFVAACIFETVVGWFFAGLAIAKCMK